jgi:hypothetical protein
VKQFERGFSMADPERLYAPVISNAVYGYQAVNVDSQQRFEHSLLCWMKSLIQVRNAFRVFSRGTMKLQCGSPISAFIAHYSEKPMQRGERNGTRKRKEGMAVWVRSKGVLRCHEALMDSKLTIFVILNGSLNPPAGAGNQAEDEAVARKLRPGSD